MGRGFGLGFLLSRLRNEEEEARFYFRCEITRLSSDGLSDWAWANPSLSPNQLGCPRM